jgi:hypothetical protein
MTERPPIADISDIEAFLGMLEHGRLEAVERIVAKNEGYNDTDLQKLSLWGDAVASVRDAIAFRKRFDAI